MIQISSPAFRSQTVSKPGLSPALRMMNSGLNSAGYAKYRFGGIPSATTTRNALR